MLSMIVCAYNMARELPRTLHTLSADYQQDLPAQYEVIVVENSSSERFDAAKVEQYGENFRYIYFDEGRVSPVRSINYAVSQAKGDIICIMNDAARMLSPCVVKYAMAAFRAFPNAVVTPLSWHLGPEVQMESVLKGYNQETEDQLLETVPWSTNGYSLFSISAIAGSSKDGWFQPIAESNCLFIRADTLERLGGLDERFASPGGGLIALDLFRNAWLLDEVQPVILLGEGTFHQVHGGVATNAPESEKQRRIETMFEEYRAIRGSEYTPPDRDPVYLGALPVEARPFLEYSIIKANP